MGKDFGNYLEYNLIRVEKNKDYQEKKRKKNGNASFTIIFKDSSTFHLQVNIPTVSLGMQFIWMNYLKKRIWISVFNLDGLNKVRKYIFF